MGAEVFKKVIKNGGSIVALGTAILSALTLYINFLIYVYYCGYFSRFKIDINFYNFNNNNALFYFLLMSVLFILFIACSLQMKNILSLWKLKYKRKALENIICIFLFDAAYTFIYANGINLLFWINLILLIIFECVFSYIFFNKISLKSIKEKNKSEWVTDIFITTVACILVSGGLGLVKATCQTEYKTIDDKYVVLYTTNDYYIVATCEIENNIITINNNCKKIETKDVQTTTRNYTKVYKQ